MINPQLLPPLWLQYSHLWLTCNKLMMDETPKDCQTRGLIDPKLQRQWVGTLGRQELRKERGRFGSSRETWCKHRKQTNKTKKVPVFFVGIIQVGVRALRNANCYSILLFYQISAPMITWEHAHTHPHTHTKIKFLPLATIQYTSSYSFLKFKHKKPRFK